MRNLLGKLWGRKAGPEEKAHQPRSPRVRVPIADDATFVMPNGKTFPLRNLSETGMALLSAGFAFPDEAWGEIRVSGERVTVKMAAVRRHGDEIGLAFTDGLAGVRALLRRVFHDEIHALEMAEVESGRQREVELGSPRWFYAPDNYELFYVAHEGELLQLELGWGENLISFDHTRGLRFGAVKDEGRGGNAYARSALVSWASEVAPELKLKALRLLENVAGIEPEIRRKMEEILKLG